MKSLANTLELQKRRIGVYEVDGEIHYKELMEDIQQKLIELEKNQRYTLSEQEKIHIKTLDIDKVLSEMVDNQKDMKKNIDTLIERWG